MSISSIITTSNSKSFITTTKLLLFWIINTTLEQQWLNHFPYQVQATMEEFHYQEWFAGIVTNGFLLLCFYSHWMLHILPKAWTIYNLYSIKFPQNVSVFYQQRLPFHCACKSTFWDIVAICKHYSCRIPKTQRCIVTHQQANLEMIMYWEYFFFEKYGNAYDIVNSSAWLLVHLATFHSRPLDIINKLTKISPIIIFTWHIIYVIQ